MTTVEIIMIFLVFTMRQKCGKIMT